MSDSEIILIIQGFLIGIVYCCIVDYFTTIRKMRKLRKDGVLETKKWRYTAERK